MLCLDRTLCTVEGLMVKLSAILIPQSRGETGFDLALQSSPAKPLLDLKHAPGGNYVFLAINLTVI